MLFYQSMRFHKFRLFWLYLSAHLPQFVCCSSAVIGFLSHWSWVFWNWIFLQGSRTSLTSWRMAMHPNQSPVRKRSLARKWTGSLHYHITHPTTSQITSCIIGNLIDHWTLTGTTKNETGKIKSLASEVRRSVQNRTRRRAIKTPEISV